MSVTLLLWLIGSVTPSCLPPIAAFYSRAASLQRHQPWQNELAAQLGVFPAAELQDMAVDLAEGL